MSIGYKPKNELTQNQALAVQELAVSGKDYALYSISGGVHASVVDTVDSPNITFTAVSAGAAGNSISLVFSGSNTVATVTSAWNTAHPANQVSFTGLGSVIPAANTWTLSGGAGSLQILIREPVSEVENVSLKVDASNSMVESNAAEISIVDSKGGLSGFNEFGQQVSDQSAINISNVAVLNPNDCLVVKYKVAAHL